MTARMKRLAAAAGALFAVASLAHSAQNATDNELRFQDVVPIAGATREQIYTAASQWFSRTFTGPEASLEQNQLAGVLVGRGAERYAPPFMSAACSGWLRYRVLLVAKDGRYLYIVDSFTHEGDPFCNKKSFGLLTKDSAGMSITRTIFNMTLAPPKRESSEREAWLDMKDKASTLAQSLSNSLQRSLRMGTARKPAG